MIGRILADDLNGSSVELEQGTVITEKDAKAIAKEFEEVSVYAGIYAQEVNVTNDNVNAVLDLGTRMYAVGRVTKKNEDLMSHQSFVNDAETEGSLTIKEGLEDDEAPEAAVVGFDDEDSSDDGEDL